MRLRREPEPSPEAIRTLAAIDAALAGDRVDPADADLRDLAVALRAERPRPRPEFELALDLRAHEGFRRDDEAGIHRAAPAQRRELHMPQRLRTTPLAVGTAAAIFIVATAVLVSGLPTLGGDDDSFRPTSRESQGSPESRATERDSGPAAGGAGSAGSSEPGSATPAPALVAPADPPDIAARARRRQVERSAALTLSAARGRIEDVADDVVRVTDGHGGFVLRSSVSAGSGAEAGASFDLRIPTTRLQSAVAEISELAHVRSRTQDAQDITGRFSAPRRRLTDALAERRGLLRQLARADTPNETAAVRARLRSANRRADRARRELRSLRQRVTLSRVSVAIEPGRDTAGKDSGWTLGDAVRDALDVLGALAGAAIVALAVAAPAALLGLLAWLAYRAHVRRRRERTLDAPSTGAPAATD